MNEKRENVLVFGLVPETGSKDHVEYFLGRRKILPRFLPGGSVN
jgi:hypothetical protein